MTASGELSGGELVSGRPSSHFQQVVGKMVFIWADCFTSLCNMSCHAPPASVRHVLSVLGASGRYSVVSVFSHVLAFFLYDYAAGHSWYVLICHNWQGKGLDAHTESIAFAASFAQTEPSCMVRSTPTCGPEKSLPLRCCANADALPVALQAWSSMECIDVARGIWGQRMLWTSPCIASLGALQMDFGTDACAIAHLLL